MRDGIYLEIIACSLTDAIAAEQGGADRIELISHYEVGGLTPPLDLVRAVVAAVSIPVRVMLRDAESFFVPDRGDRAILERTARELNQLPIDGLVFGFLRPSSINGQTEIDLELVERLLEPEIEQVASGALGSNHKSLLQQWAQRDFGVTPTYEVLRESGPDHSKSFYVTAQIGHRCYSPAWGRNKKEAEQRAASNALAELGLAEPTGP